MTNLPKTPLVVSQKEARILTTLNQLSEPSTVIEISEKIGGEICDHELYSILERLLNQSLVIRTSIPITIQGISLTKIVWRLSSKEYYSN